MHRDRHHQLKALKLSPLETSKNDYKKIKNKVTRKIKFKYCSKIVCPCSRRLWGRDTDNVVDFSLTQICLLPTFYLGPS